MRDAARRPLEEHIRGPNPVVETPGINHSKRPARAWHRRRPCPRGPAEPRAPVRATPAGYFAITRSRVWSLTNTTRVADRTTSRSIAAIRCRGHAAGGDTDCPPTDRKNAPPTAGRSRDAAATRPGDPTTAARKLTMHIRGRFGERAPALRDRGRHPHALFIRQMLEDGAHAPERAEEQPLFRRGHRQSRRRAARQLLERHVDSPAGSAGSGRRNRSRATASRAPPARRACA